MDGENVGLLIAFAAGILSFLSPCVLPLIPGYIGLLAGVTVQTPQTGSVRKAALVQAVFFVLGFSVVFVAVGSSVGLMGSLLYDNMSLLRKIGGVFLIVMGLHVTGLITIPFLYQERRINLDPKREAGYLTSFLIGVVFAVGWSPCIGPILGAILALAFSSATAWQGTYLLAAYSLGLGVPFLITALALTTVSRQLKRLNRHMNLVTITSGTLMIVMGTVFLTGLMGRIMSYLTRIWIPPI